MRLKSIKLAGFKSFVDPTKISFPTNLSAIVGPNGCGKSNTIDAVRWVMGESSAKYLRGESKTDVIFNGSSARKPVSQCSVELIFDNSDHSLKGELASYNEISVRRKVTRDGDANYFLNGTKCRRKDITDLFLGTGLGPRSYAIIEQGMISRLIESKPEELRVYIEEAAGISRYKERRRETEARMKRTRENLARLSDLREELDRQLQHLQRQAQAAEKYKALKQEERKVRADLAALKWQRLHAEVGSQEREIALLETEYEAITAKVRHCEAEHERLREQHQDANEAFNQTQKEFYQVGNDIARFEQTLQSQREQAALLMQNIRETEQLLVEAKRQTETDGDQTEARHEALALLQPKLESASAALNESNSTLSELENQQQQWQNQWDDFNQNAQGPKRQAEVAQSRIQHLERILEQLHRRDENLHRERSEIAANPEAEALAKLLRESEKLSTQSESLQQQLNELSERRHQCREEVTEQRSKLEQTNQQLQRHQARQETVAALIKASLSEESSGVSDWLTGQQLHEAKRLAQTLQVASGWELAVETVLGEALQAVQVPNLRQATDAIKRLQEGTLTLVGETEQAPELPEDSLYSKVSSNCSVEAWLAPVRTVASLPEALARLAELATGESFITQDGIWLGPNWLKVKRGEDSQHGLISLQQEQETLTEQLNELETAAEDQSVNLDVSQMQLNGLEQERENSQQQYQQLMSQLADVKAAIGGKQAQAKELAARNSRIAAAITEVETQTTEERAALTDEREQLQQALAAMQEDVDLRDQLSQQRDELKMAIDEQRDQVRSAREAQHQLQLQRQQLQSELDSLQAAFERAQTQHGNLTERLQKLNEQASTQTNPETNINNELQQRLAQQVALESLLSEQRAAVESIVEQMRAGERNRQSAEEQATAVRTKLEQERMALQAVSTRRTTLQEQLEEQQYNLDQVLAELPEGADEEQWQLKLEQLATKVQRLGLINLAAIEEFQIQKERKGYLDAQDVDLQKALAVLENAIRKIDRETRTRFKDTFDRVNTGLQELFPRVFGGGHAYLDLTSDELLETGVTIMARPPGKKNSTIHLLSGGEKALTAIALVFSIFRLNPAPFCMLDEVDAPLDDANVDRYAKLVKAMAETVQFIFITHNKGAMEMAQQLMGVTMNEPGVSRLVSVNVDEAAELATT